MPILAVYNQTFTTSQLATFQWTFHFQPRMKTKPNSRFLIKANQIAATTSSITPAISNNQLNLFMSNTEMCGRNENIILAPSPLGEVRQNELNATNSNQYFICNEFPLSPIVFATKFTSTLLTPTAGNYLWSAIFTIYEFDGDIPDTVIS